VSLDPPQWALALLSRLGNNDPDQPTQVALETWFRAEGGGFGNIAAFNPLNTTKRMPGSHAINSVGVQAYTSDEQGIQATAETIEQNNFIGIHLELVGGTTCPRLARVVASGPWGTGDFSHLCPVQPTPQPSPEDLMNAVVTPDGKVHVYAASPQGHLLDFTRDPANASFDSVIDVSAQIGNQNNGGLFLVQP
jgi:hypothetical protein